MTNVTEYALLNDIRSVAKRVKVLTRTKYRNLGRFSSTTLENHFGTFAGALAVAGVKNTAKNR